MSSGVQSYIPLFLFVTFVLHGVVFTLLGIKRRKMRYFLLAGTFTFLTVIYFIQFEGWFLTVPGTDFPLTWLLRIGATFCTGIYIWSLSGEEGSWVWKLARRKRAE